MTDTIKSGTKRDLVFTRVFGAPVQGLPPEMPKEVRNKVIFKDLGNGKTQITVTEYDWTVGYMMEMSKMGMEQCLDKMAAIVAKAPPSFRKVR
jgi:hypothetical protein